MTSPAAELRILYQVRDRRFFGLGDVEGRPARDPFSWDATNKSARFTVGNVSRPGFWRNWGGLGG